MRIKRTLLFTFFCCTIIIVGCRKEAFDAYYGRPKGLASPIYQQLDSMGDFKYFLSCIEKAGYRNVLGSAASWTVFAPTDRAFLEFMSESGISDTSQIDKKLAEKIVRTAMVYDGERLEKLGDYFSSRGWVEDYGFRRRTVYYDFVEDEVQENGKIRKIVSTNRGVGIPYLESENNNKHLTYFFTEYMSARNLGSDDYKTFYPNSNYTGLNVLGATIDPTRSNLIAENGYIHVVDKVLMPEKNIDQYLQSNPEYSEFKNMLNFFTTYSYNTNLTRKNEVLTGRRDSVFVKGYIGVSLALNNENYVKEEANDAQTNNFSVTIPTNAAVRDYANRVLLKYYPSGTTIKDLFYSNPSVLTAYINSHLYNAQLWPSKFVSQPNITGETTKLTTQNIVEAKLLSNGAFYGVNSSQQANVFQSVYGNVLLDPKYSFMRTALERLGLNITLRMPTIRYMLVLVSDETLYDMGFSYDAYNTSDPIRYNGANGSPEMREIINSHIIPLETDPIPTLSGNGILESFAGEYIKFNNMKLMSSGTQDSVVDKKYVKIDSISIGNSQSGPLNGIAVYLDGALTSSNTNTGNLLISLGADKPQSPYYKFFNYLKASSLYSASDGVVKGVDIGANYTFLIPNNAAIDAAIANNHLPASPTTTDIVLKNRINLFLQYHITRNSFAIDGKKKGTFETLCKDIEGTTQVLEVLINQNNRLQIRDNALNLIEADVVNSNQLGQRLVIHSLSGYLRHGF
ncbi:fasciclin domain-containing protein [Sphingobacterium bovistauri]|uniref:Fasciclin domain-containing protein n=1 Tax=Sphingobacterium bovistauri TaxID=2781959 RepID=A0ABS7Z4M3_9SPHI|nr:fasciclin domain-containing protein [Sphingobacterium bovistauri]MCA5003835.1 fasciclin domain-containing protein [Sphingobacterium bovistauri]